MRLALGTAQFGLPYGIANISGQVTQNDAQAILEYAASVGIETIDTAIAYGDSEQCLGRVGASAFNVITKLPVIPDTVSDVENWIIRSVNGSISRLGIDSLYGLMLHRPHQLLEGRGAEIITVLQHLKRSGIVKKIGVSTYAPSEFGTLFDFHDFDIVQCPFSLVDQRLVTSGWLKKLKRYGVEVHVRSVFLQGLLLMPAMRLPASFKKWKSIWDTWEEWLLKNETSALEACLSYVLSFSEIDRVVVGIDSRDQLVGITSIYPGRNFNDYPAIDSDDINLVNPVNWRLI